VLKDRQFQLPGSQISSSPGASCAPIEGGGQVATMTFPDRVVEEVSAFSHRSGRTPRPSASLPPRFASGRLVGRLGLKLLSESLYTLKKIRGTQRIV